LFSFFELIKSSSLIIVVVLLQFFYSGTQRASLSTLSYNNGLLLFMVELLEVAGDESMGGGRTGFDFCATLEVR